MTPEQAAELIRLAHAIFWLLVGLWGLSAYMAFCKR